MITNDNLSLEKLYSFLKSNASGKVERHDHMLTLNEGDHQCVISVIGSIRIILFKPLTLNIDSCSIGDRLSLVNTLNSDLSYMSTAYLDEDNELAFKHSISVAGGIDEFSFLMVALEFTIECSILEQVIKNNVVGKA